MKHFASLLSALFLLVTGSACANPQTIVYIGSTPGDAAIKTLLDISSPVLR